MGEVRIAYSILVGKPEGKRPVGRPRRRWEDNIRTDLREIEWEGVHWMHLGPVSGPCEHGNEPSGSIKDEEFLEYLNES
jgi:hypothetical protein